MLVRAFLYVFIFFMLPFYGIAQQESSCFPKAPNPPRLVNDFAKVLSPQTTQGLEQHLVNFNDTTSTQITIVTLTDLCGYEASQFAFAIGENWGVGSKEFNNGIVLLVKPKIGNEFGEVFIATGYGLEAVLPDAIAKRIVEREMIPNFRNEDYESGIVAAVQVLMEITGGEYSAQDYNNKHTESIPLYPLLILFFIVFLMFAKTFKRARKYAKTNNISFWLALMLLGSMQSRHRGHYDSFSSGSNRFGGGGGGFGRGGGFGGFGGGSFGGGGAGGRW